MAIPSRVGYTVVRHVFGSGPQTEYIDIPAGTLAGDHMIVFVEWAGGLPSGMASGAPDWPAGWQQIEYENHGTRGYAVWYAGTYVSGPTLTVTFNALGGSGATFSLATIRGAAPFSSWTIGTWWDRNGLGGGTMNTTTRALGISAPSNSLVLSFHGEATNATEDSATSVTGATKWYESGPQTVASSNIERVYVAYREVSVAETTPNVDVIWPNSAQNGAAIQVAIPEDSTPPEPSDEPVVDGWRAIRHASNTAPTPLDISDIAVGSWMIVSVMNSSSAIVTTSPAGWTRLHARETTGTRSNTLFAKIKESGDGSTAGFTQSSNNTVAYALLWGSNAAPVASWTIGDSWVRSTSGEPSGARYQNILPSVTTTHNNSLVVGISHEATLAMEAEYEISSVSAVGWTERLYLPQVAVNDRIETIWMGSKVLATPGDSGDVTVTYMSPVDNNGWGIQIAIPPPMPESSEVPYVVGYTEFAGAATASSITINKPSGVQNGDMLVAVLRSQSSTSSTDWSLSGWTRQGPAFPGSNSARVNTVLTRLISNASGEPASYTFSRGVSDSNRRAGQIIHLRADGGVPEVESWDPTYAGENPAGAVDIAPFPHTITPPVLDILWAAAEFASPQDHAIATYPADYTTIGYTLTSSDTGISRTTLYTGWHVYTSGTTTIQAGPDYTGSASGPAAGAVSFKIGAMPDQSGSGLMLVNGLGQGVTVYHTVTGGVRTPQSITPMRRGFTSVAQMLATPGFTWAHRGGSSSYPEHSLYAYTQAVYRGYGVLEISLGRTSDGVWFGLHDQTTDRTSGGTYGNASSQTWAQIQAQQIVEDPENPQPYMRWDELIAIYGSTHIIVADPKYALGSYRTEFLNMVNNDLGPTRAIIKYSGVGSGAAALSTAAQALGFQTWGFFYAGDASSAQGGSGALQTWGPSWTLIGMEYGASQAIWDEVLALGKPAIGHIAPNQAAYDTAIAKGASGVQVSGVAVVRPVSWWAKPYPKIVGVRTSSRTGSGALSVTLPEESGGCYMVLLVGDNAPTQPSTPAGWTLVNWSTGNPVLNMGIYMAPSTASAPVFTLTQPHNGGFVATAMRFNTDTIDITGSGGNNTMTSTAMTATKPGYMIWSLSASLNDVPPATFTYPTGVPDWHTSIVSGGTEGGVALGIACVAVPAAGPINSVTWGMDNQSTVRAGGFFITYPS